jgi:hypothetical protein
LQNGSWNDSEKAGIERHLLSGIGYYHLWVLRLQAEFQLDLRGMFDMPLPVGDGCLSSSKYNIIMYNTQTHFYRRKTAKEN